MRGEDERGEWVRCQVCFELHRKPWWNLAVDADGVRWDVCAGECARDAGIVEETPQP